MLNTIYDLGDSIDAIAAKGIQILAVTYLGD